MRRREFIELFGGALMAWPLPAQAQQTAAQLIGFLHSASAAGYAPELAAFRDALKEAAFVEGGNIAIEFRWADDQSDQLPKLAEELVQHHPAVLVAAGGGQSALAAQAATSSIPIVFHNGSDAVRLGLVASLNRPGGNITGITNLGAFTALKRMDVLRQAVPAAEVIAYLTNPSNPNSENGIREISSAARLLGRDVVFLSVAGEKDLAAAFATLVQRKVGALMVSADPMFTNRVDQVIALASRYSIPTMFPTREHAIAGGLMSYGASYVDTYRQLGTYTARILKGEKPTDLPVVQATKFDLVINLKTAKALGLEIPPTLLALADEVVE